ncbi:alkaline phosphatase family protein [Haloechinothrix sp. LS1_15]|uniref:alkaline phosphatase family protein n=1 Tax=Haloechinothrix sp. LS1_15 TaxID=2652248 RepID=UPI0029451FD1|nr:alkaline phosphatase family protein [Haloechinothrix sp. LS1_15]MDV6014147.1 sulfatase-like hydrolase/transferase [Haloechinothrix sp. LS1_15]
MSPNRRTVIAGALAGGLITVAGPRGAWARTAPSAGDPVRVYLIIVDGLRIDEVPLMPQLSELAGTGTYYPEARAQMSAETTPNHISMLTGMRADRHGMPGNAVPGLPIRVSDDPRYLKADSILTLMRRQAPDLRSATIGAKDYVAESAKHDRTGDGEQDTTYSNDPITSNPATFDSARDEETGTEALLVSREHDPDFLFLNLGDVDRYGHFDETGGLTGGELPALRRATLLTADQQLRHLVTELRSSGRWERTVFIVTADHSMDWSFRDALVNLAPAFAEDSLLADEVFAAVNGGACLYGLRSPDEPKAGERLRRMREIALSVEAVEEALYLHPNPDDGGKQHWVGRHHPHWGLGGDFSGELLVTVKPGFRIGHHESAPLWLANPIPGNHGHPVTLPIPIVVSGGWEGLRQQVVEPDGQPGVADEDPSQARNIDLAPTAAWLLGLYPPPGGFDGRVLHEAFRMRPPSRVAVSNVASMPTVERLAGGDDFGDAVAVSSHAFPDGADAVVVVPAEAPWHAAGAVPLAIRRGGPILPARASGVPRSILAEVRRLGPERAYILGGKEVLGGRVERELTSAGVSEVRRLAGDDAAATAAEVAVELGVAEANRQAILVDGAGDSTAGGRGLADAIAAGPVGGARYPADFANDDRPRVLDQSAATGELPRGRRPVLLSGDTSLPETTRAALTELDIDRVLVAGGTHRVPAALEESLRGEGMLVERIGARGPGETGRRWAERGVREGAYTDELWLAAERATLPSLAAAAAAGYRGGTLLLIPPGELSQRSPARRFLTERSDEFVHLRIAGGEDTFPGSLADAVIELLHQRRTRSG